MDPTTILDYSPTSAEGNGRGDNVDALQASSTGVSRDISSVLSGENAFLYGGFVIDGPKNLPSLSYTSSGYEWASRDVSDFPSFFNSRPILQDWVNDSCILKTLGYNSCINLTACGENERVFHGKGGSGNDFF